MLLSLTGTSNLAVATFLAKDRLPLTGTKSRPAMAVPGVALKGTLAGKARAPERVTVMVAFLALSLTMKVPWVKAKVESSLRTIRFAVERAPSVAPLVGLLSARFT